MSAEQQISAAYLATGSDDLDRIDLEMLREAAVTLFNQYLSDKVRDDTQCVAWWCLTCEYEVVGSAPGRVALKWLLLGWAAVSHPCQLSLSSLWGCKSSAGMLGGG